MFLRRGYDTGTFRGDSDPVEHRRYTQRVRGSARKALSLYFTAYLCIFHSIFVIHTGESYGDGSEEKRADSGGKAAAAEDSDYIYNVHRSDSARRCDNCKHIHHDRRSAFEKYRDK